MNAEQPVKKRGMNVLKYAEKIRLCDYLRCQRERIENERLGPSALAVEVNADDKLNLPKVTKDHVRAALRACEIPVIRNRAACGRKAVENRRMLRELVAQLAVRCDQLEARCAKSEADHAALLRLVEETAGRLSRK